MKKVMLIVTAVLFSTSIIIAQDVPVKAEVKKEVKDVKQQVKTDAKGTRQRDKDRSLNAPDKSGGGRNPQGEGRKQP